MVKIYINPYSVYGGFTIAYEIAKAADAIFNPGMAGGYCSIETEEKAKEAICELLKENHLEFNIH
jgi:hypothetical protein